MSYSPCHIIFDTESFIYTCLDIGTNLKIKLVSFCEISFTDTFFLIAPQAQTEMVLVCNVCYDLLMNQADKEKQS